VTKRQTLLILLPLGLLGVAGAALQALPGYVSSPAHRVQMESVASSLTGRQVHINGALSLDLLPLRITATGITISGPDNETITARALAMDLSGTALLRGQVAANSLTLTQPAIALPWPLPGGPKAVATPTLLAALQAHVQDGTLALGGLTVTGITADITTQPGGAFSLSGNGTLAGLPVSTTLALAPADLTGSAPLSVELGTADASVSLNGTLTATGDVTGKADFTLPEGVTGTAQVDATAAELVANPLSASAGTATVSGTARLAFAPLALSADLTAQNLNLDTLPHPAGLFTAPLPVTLHLAATALTWGGQSYPALTADLTSAPAATVLRNGSLTLPGGGTLSGTGSLTPDGTLSGTGSLDAPDLSAALAGYALPPVTGWPAAHVSAQFSGTPAALTLRNLAGTLGADHFTGTLVLTPGHASGALAFDHLALAPLSTWLTQRPAGDFTADAEITAATASAGPVQMSHFALDGGLDGTLNIRRVSAALYGGLAAGSFTLDSSGQVTSAHGFLDIPSAKPLAALLPAAWAPPSAVLAPRLTLALAARGPADALATSAVLTLGDFTLTAAPVLDLVHGSASGAVSLRHPIAAAALRLFGLPTSSTYPGPGSAALRASFTASATSWGLPDFVLSFGDLTATGRLMMANGALSGDIAADTLALPAVPTGFSFPSLPALTGKVSLTANTVQYGGTPLTGPVAATLTLTPSTADLGITRAALAGGNVTASLHAALDPVAPPKFALAVQAQGLNAPALGLNLPFPYPLLSGQVGGNASLTASGFSPNIWLATLGGTATLTASNGVLRGVSLGDLDSALTSGAGITPLRVALTSGTTPFATLTLGATLAQGNAALTQGQLVSPLGTIGTQPGSYIDIYDQTFGLRLGISPAVRPPLTVTQITLGPWAKPKHIAHLTAAMAWKPES